MEDLLQRSKDRAGTIRMTADEKAAIRSRLSAYMTMRPLRNTKVADTVLSPRRLFAFLPRPTPLIASLLVMVLAGGGVSYAAEGSMPGDALYPVKVRVNEEVRSALAIDDEAKADWAAARAERRLNEARAVLETETDTPEILDTLEARFAQHEERVEATIAKLEEKRGPEAAVRISSHFETSLAAHEAILGRLSERERGAEADHDQDRKRSEERVERFTKRVEQAREKVKEVRERMERKAADQPEAQERTGIRRDGRGDDDHDRD